MKPGKSPRAPILVTGAPRTGTTWVGHVLAQAPRVAYLHEPLNVGHDPGLCGAKIEYTFPYICDRNEQNYLPYLRETLKLRYRPLRALRQARSLKLVRMTAEKTLQFRRYRRLRSRPLIKDPVAVFSADWLSRRFQADTVVMVRHPAGFARSYMAKQWTHPFSDFLAQPLLLEDRLSEFADEIRFFAEHEQPVIDQAALLWKLVYADLLVRKSEHPEWLFTRYEDLCSDPAAGFKELLSALGLEFTEHVQTLVDSSGTTQDRAEWGELPANLQKDSASRAMAWKQEMSAADIRRLRERVAPIAEEYYAESDW